MRLAIWLLTSCKDEKSVNTRQLNRSGEEMYPWGDTEIAGRKTETGRRKSAWSLTSPAFLQACSDTQSEQTRWNQQLQNTKSILWQLLRFTNVQHSPLEAAQKLLKCFCKVHLWENAASASKIPIFSSPWLAFLWAEVASENCFLKRILTSQSRCRAFWLQWH